MVARLGSNTHLRDAQAAGAFNAALVVLSAGKPRTGMGDGRDRCVGSARVSRPIRVAEKAKLLGGGAEVVRSETGERRSGTQMLPCLTRTTIEDNPPFCRRLRRSPGTGS